MKARFVSILLLAFGCGLASADGERYVTITGQGISSPPYNVTNTVSVAAGETAEVVSVYPSGGNVSFTKDGYWFSSIVGEQNKLVTVKGPATFALIAAQGQTTMLTLKITPDTFPPGQTLIIPQGTGAIVHVESSTNLTTWTNVWSSTYTNAPDVRFFRLTAERL
jgi:hypothetical protein